MKFIRILISIGIAQLAGIIGSFFTVNSIASWYATLVRPEWNPPNWIFGPVWITLYTLMGYAAFLIWEKRALHPRTTLALFVYGAHLICNALWSIIFFGMQNPRLAFFEILILDALLLCTTVLFWRISRRAAFLLFPYIGWVLFATYLNYTIWILN